MLFLGADMLFAPENDFWGRSSHDLPLQIHVQKIKKKIQKQIDRHLKILFYFIKNSYKSLELGSSGHFTSQLDL